jgi:hypothetical protein
MSRAWFVLAVVGLTACASYKGGALPVPSVGTMLGWRVDGDVGIGADPYAQAERQKLVFDANLAKDGILAVHVLVQNQAGRGLTVRASEMSLTLPDGRHIAAAPSELVAMKVGEEESVLGWTLGFGLIGYLASSRAEEQARTARIDNYRDKQFPEVTLTPQQTAHGMVFFIPPPATPAFDQAVLVVRLLDAEQQSTLARVPLSGLGYRGAAARNVPRRSSPPRGTLISATNPIVGEWSGTFSPQRPNASRPVAAYPAILRIYEDGAALRWSLEVEGFTLRGRGTATRFEDGVVLAGRQGRAATISYTLTMKDQKLEGSGVGADNRVYTLSVQKQARP